MDPLKHRREEVRALRAAFAKTANEARDKLNPTELFENALDFVDSRTRFLRHVQAGVRRNPLLAGILLMGAAWLIRDGGGSEGRSNRRRKPDKTAPANTNIKGDYDDSEPDNRDQWSDFQREKQNGPQP